VSPAERTVARPRKTRAHLTKPIKTIQKLNFRRIQRNRFTFIGPQQQYSGPADPGPKSSFGGRTHGGPHRDRRLRQGGSEQAQDNHRTAQSRLLQSQTLQVPQGSQSTGQNPCRFLVPRKHQLGLPARHPHRSRRRLRFIWCGSAQGTGLQQRALFFFCEHFARPRSAALDKIQ